MELTKIYQHAIKNNYALGAFNFYNLESMTAILETAQKLSTPVIMGVSESAFKYFRAEFLKGAIASAKKTYNIPFFVHLDHGKSLEFCKNAIDVGFDSVMIDGSHLPFEQNIALTKSVVDYARPRGIQVEGELGKLKGIEDDVVSSESLYTDPKEAKIFVEQTGVDSLAIAIGTSHGINKFSGKAEIRFDILEQIQNTLPNFPLVLHGASSVDQETINNINSLGGTLKNAKGVPEDILQVASTKYNICKINVDSDLRMATTYAVRKYLSENTGEIDPRKYLTAAKNEMSKLVNHKITNVFKTRAL